ncbi:MAG: tRNA lysidine(34) synthetase TilS [Methylotenera sp.]|nr:MAG: tRNA lysidine(34) synthetase TilS [Methylotenera sp.]
MANSKKSLANNRSGPTAPHPLTLKLHTFLADCLKPQQRLLLALSGGLDSCVLLHLLANAKATIGYELQALHVHHGLSNNANAWANFCVEQCRELQVPCEVVQVQVPKDSGLGIESAARRLRYEILFNYHSNGLKPDFVLTAHHQDDQAETLLLQMLRGAGVKGLAAMAAEDGSRGLLRPLLDISRTELHDYALQHKLTWCEDESNSDSKFERNFLRNEVMPLLTLHYPALTSNLARTAVHLAEANKLLDSLAMLDISPLEDANSLCLLGLSQLTEARAKNGLRWWLAKNGIAMPSADQLQEMLKQLLDAKPDAKITIQVYVRDLTETKNIKRYQQRAYLVEPVQALTYDVLWQGESEIELADRSRLIFNKTTGTGLAVKHGLAKLRVTNRKGGERFKPNALKPTRTLKHLLQEANIPPWQREQLPLIYWQDSLAYVPGIGIAHELQAAEDEPGLEIIWQPA